MSDTSPQSASKRGRAEGARHVVELPLTVTESDRHRLERRFAAANTLRNGVLESALRALDVCRADPAWAAARLLPGSTKPERAARSAAFAAAREHHGLTETALCAVERRMREACWIGDHVTARLGHVIVKDVLKAIEGHMFLRRGGPRFRCADDCRTISARQSSPMILKGSPEEGYAIRWSGLTLRVRREDFSASELHSLGCGIVHCRVKRIPSGRVAPASPWRYAVQVVVRGAPMIHRPRADHGVVGLDLGPGVVAAVWRDGPEGAGHALIPLAAEVAVDDAAIARAKRGLDRSLRAANPDCYDAAGRCRKRPRRRSKRWLKAMARQRRAEARAARRRRNSHGRDANRLLAAASEIRLEDHGFRGMTALWGRRIGRCAPGLFVSELCRKATDAGGSVVRIDSRKAALSQVDACGGERMRKPLAQRWHALGPEAPAVAMGGFVQRDLHSALLASRCDAAGLIDRVGVRADLEGACQRLVEPTAALAASVQAARPDASRPVRPSGRRSGPNGCPEVPRTRETMSRRQRRRDWLRARIATRRARGTSPPDGGGVRLACTILSPASFRV